MDVGPAPSNRATLGLLLAGLLVGLALGGIIFFGLPTFGSPLTGSAPLADGPTATPAPAPIVGAPAPDFTLTALDGQAVTLSALKGQVVLINFWATWCSPCRYEMPAIQKRYDAYKDQGLVVLAVDFDEAEDVVADFVRDMGLTFTVLLDPGGQVNEQYRVRGYPTTYVVDRAGMITRLHIGSMTEEQIDGYLEGLGLK